MVLLVLVVIFLVTPASGSPPLAQQHLERWGFTTAEALELQVMLVILVFLLVVAETTFQMLG